MKYPSNQTLRSAGLPVANVQAMQTVVDDLHKHGRAIAPGGPGGGAAEASRRVKLCRASVSPLACSIRVTPFLEISARRARHVRGDVPPARHAGIGRIHGAECVIVANDATVKGGTYYPDGEEHSRG